MPGILESRQLNNFFGFFRSFFSGIVFLSAFHTLRRCSFHSAKVLKENHLLNRCVYVTSKCLFRIFIHDVPDFDSLDLKLFNDELVATLPWNAKEIVGLGKVLKTYERKFFMMRKVFF